MNAKNLSLILNAVLLLAVAALFVLVLGKKKEGTTKHAVRAGDTIESVELPIAYVNIDSLLLNYTFAKNANEALISKQESSRATLNTKARQLQDEMEEYKRKLNAQAFLSRERAAEVEEGLMRKQQDLQKLEATLSQQLMEQNQKLNEQLRDTINSFLKQYNKDGKYEMIITNTSNDNILYAKEKYNITSEIIKRLNERNKEKK